MTAATAKRDDRRTAMAAAYAGSTDPFPEGSRLSRYFAKARQHVETMDAAFRDLEEVYGTIGTPRMREPDARAPEAPSP